jgi:hypothetical protein
MAKRPAKSLDDLDRYIHEDNLKRDPEASMKRTQGMFAILGLIMLVAGLATIIFGIVEARKFTSNGRWPAVTGTITDVNVYFVNRRRGPDDYCVSGTYQYVVRDRTYAHSWTIGGCSSSRSTAEANARSYLNGTAPIWYDPTNPDRSSNMPIGMEWMLIVWGAGILVLIFSAVLLSLAVQKPEVKRKFKQPARPL